MRTVGNHVVMATAAVRISARRKEYPGRAGHQSVVAVDGIDVEIAAGEIVAFLGPNGAGKTTTLDIALGLVPPTSGTVEVLGTTPRRAVIAGKVSAVLQTGGLLRDLSVGETVRAVAALHHADARVDDVVRRAGLDRLVARKVGKCSGGEQQRLRFALALLPDPQLLILDEPTAGMDAGARREFWETMHAETSEGRTVVFATHYLEEAQATRRGPSSSSKAASARTARQTSCGPWSASAPSPRACPRTGATMPAPGYGPCRACARSASRASACASRAARPTTLPSCS